MKINIISIIVSFSATIVFCCCSESDAPFSYKKGEHAVALATIGDNLIQTRHNGNSYDKWSVASFSAGDMVGFYAIEGGQNSEDENIFDQEIVNQIMYFEGATGSYNRFSNPDLLIDPQTVHDNYSMMYYPYFKDMPVTYDGSAQPGIPIRTYDDVSEMEKGVDIMQTFVYTSTTQNNTNYGWNPYVYVNYLGISTGILQPRFYHLMSEIVIQRGQGFEDADDERIWVVMKNPCTDVRFTQTSRTSSFNYKFQNLLDDGTEFVELPDNNGKVSRLNKHRVWECWKGSPYSNRESYYAIIPPQEVAYILIKDNNGLWQKVTDFYLYFENQLTSKQAILGHRYVINVTLQDSEVRVWPVSVENWNNGGKITDTEAAGINNPKEYSEWVRIYNQYTNERDPQYIEQLRPFGDVVINESTGEANWTFYLYTNLDFSKNPEEGILKLDDKLIGASVYSNYVVSNLKSTWIGMMGENGVIKALDFENLYIIDIEENNEFFTGGLIGKMEGGLIDHCNINNGILVSNKWAGMIAGSIITGTISNCRISGLVIGNSTASEPHVGLFGTDADENNDPIIIDTNYNELYFENYSDSLKE